MAHNNNDQTGLLTRFVPEKLKHSSFYPWFLRFMRILQFLSAVISLGIFSQRVYKVYRLVNTIKRRHGINHSYGAVEGILAAAVLYTLISMILSFLLRGRGPKSLRWLWVLFDLIFVGAFIAVAVLTRPNGGNAGPHHCYNSADNDRTSTGNGRTSRRDDSCNLPWGTFILAIISTVLHAITAAFHEVRDHRRQRRAGDYESSNGTYDESKRSMDPHGHHSEGRHSNVDSHHGAGVNGMRNGHTTRNGNPPNHNGVTTGAHNGYARQQVPVQDSRQASTQSGLREMPVPR